MCNQIKIFILLSLNFNIPVSVNRNYALTSLKDSTKFVRDNKGIPCSQQFEFQTFFISDIREVFSVLANQQLIKEMFSWKAKAALPAYFQIGSVLCFENRSILDSE